MREVAEEVLKYFQDNLLATLIIVFFASFAALKTVAPGKGAGFFYYISVGLLGTYLGQYLLIYFGLKEFLLEYFSNLRLLFDFLAAYVGSFALVSIFHFVKPL